MARTSLPRNSFITVEDVEWVRPNGPLAIHSLDIRRFRADAEAHPDAGDCEFSA